MYIVIINTPNLRVGIPYENINLLFIDLGFCDDGWVQFGSMCYYFKLEFEDRSKFSEALEYCRLFKDGNLVSIHSRFGSPVL